MTKAESFIFSSSRRQAGPAAASALQRGMACVICRKRKIRCDGTKPTCSQCKRTSRPGEACVYNDPGGSKTQILEENVARLEARVRELEEPAGHIVLANPYAPTQPESGPLLSAPLVSPDITPSISPHILPRVSSSPAGPSSELPARSTHMLVESFLPYAAEFGFFLNTERFQQSVYPTSVDTVEPLPALLAAVCLWGTHLSNVEELSRQEPTYLTQVLNNLATSLTQDHPRKVIHTIQAEVLLSTYFFRMQRPLEGQYHVGAAGALALSAQLHKAGSSFGGASNHLGLSLDAVQEEERIRAFWEVYNLSVCWSTNGGFTSNIGADNIAQIDTPWPSDNLSLNDAFSLRGHTLLEFPTLIFADCLPNPSAKALHAQAVFLYESAIILARQFHLDMTHSDSDAFIAVFNSHNQLLDQFKNLLPVPTELHDPQTTRTLLLAHTLAHVAVIRLNEILGEGNAALRYKYVTSVEAVVNIYDSSRVEELGFFNPICATLWTTVTTVLISTLDSIRALRASIPAVCGEHVCVAREDDVEASLEKALSIMALISLDCPLMSQQLQHVQSLIQRRNAYESRPRK